jgi:CDGSH-type Zn-finger protein
MIKAAICNSEWPVTRDKIKKLEHLSALDLQEKFKCLNSSLTESLNAKGHALRQLRNKISHKGSSPEDDYECIHLFFRGGVSYFEACLSFAISSKIKDSMGNESEWFWSIYQKTRKAVSKFSEKSKDSELRQGMFYLSRASQKCLTINKVNRYYHPSQGYLIDHILDGSHGDIEFEARSAAYGRIKNSFEKEGMEVCPAHVEGGNDKSNILTGPMSFNCPVCDGDDGIIGFKTKEIGNDNWEFESLKAFSCLNDLCILSGIPYLSSRFLEVFFEDALTDNVKRFLAEEGGDFNSPFEV